MYPPCRRQSTARNFLRTGPFPRTPRLDCRAKSADFPVYASNSRATSPACVKPADSSSPLQQIHLPPRTRPWRRVKTDVHQYLLDPCPELVEGTAGSSITATSFNLPPHAQRSISMSNTRFNNRAHVMRTGALCSCLESPSPVVVFCAGTDTTLDRSFAFGASTP